MPTYMGTPDDGDRDSGDLQTIWGNGHAGPSDIPSSSSFSSAVRRNDTTPAKRRHAGSDAAARRTRTDHDPWTGEGVSHARARTLDSDTGEGPSWRGRGDANQHPLWPPSVASSSSVTLDHDTRPSMKRMLTRGDEADAFRERVEDSVHTRSRSHDKEMLVIVHEVQPTDSLAGVALKYGISLAELRRANQLWTSDTIHLRNALYIPVEKARHVRHLKNASLDGDAQPDHPDPPASGPGPPPEEDIPSREADNFTLRRVPASQLSYFPPPNQSSPPRPSRNIVSAQTLPSRRPSKGPARPSIPVSFSRSHDAPLQSVLDVFSTSLHSTASQLRAYAQAQGSLFTGFPAKQSASLASRLSLDSASATASSASEDLEWEHELDDIGARPRRRPETLKAHAGKTFSGLATSSEGHDSVELDAAPFSSSPPDGRLTSKGSSARAGSRLRRNSSGRSRGEDTEKRIVPYAGVDDGGMSGPQGERGVAAVTVRTAQLEPSPGMQLPALQRRRPRTGES
ncbi:hypothetical protein C8Q79DRAFT_1015249 [Trametes meyenii]|nr:hypothetical protein C8Q79DRAFT_1015249 [Trametes meyenii]